MPSLEPAVDLLQIGVVELSVCISFFRKDCRERHDAAFRDALGSADLVDALHRARDE